jgi:hypothetical protein
MVVDDFVCDPQANAGGMDINIVHGSVTLFSSEIAKVAPDVMKVNLPVATGGI